PVAARPAAAARRPARLVGGGRAGEPRGRPPLRLPRSADRASMNATLLFWRRFRRNPAAVGGLAVLLLVVAAAIFGPMLHPLDPFDMVGRPSQPPSARFLLGTDVSGRDMLAGLLHGARVSLIVGIVASVVATAVGLL